MTRYIVRRLLLAIPVLIGVSIVVFWMIRAIPGDPARVLAGEGAPLEVVERIREQYGLNEPLHVQYMVFLKHLLQGDLGRSIRSRRPVTEEVAARLGPTLELAAGSMVVAIVIGVSTGILSAVRPNSWIDAASTFIALVGISMPVFWLGLMLMYFFSYELGWFPTAGRGTWRHLVLPSLTLGLSTAAIIARMTRTSMLEVLRQEYVRTARAKALHEWAVVLKHAFRNAHIPIVTFTGLQMESLF